MAGEFKRLKVELLPADLSDKPAAVVYDDGLVSPFAEPRVDSELSILVRLA